MFLAQAFKLSTQILSVSGLNTAGFPVCQLADDTLYHFLAAITFDSCNSFLVRLRMCPCLRGFPGDSKCCCIHSAGLRRTSGPTEDEESFSLAQLGCRACKLQRQPALTFLPDEESPPAMLHERVMATGDPFCLVAPCGNHSFSLSSKPVFRCALSSSCGSPGLACRLTHLQSSVSHMCFPEQYIYAIRLAGLETRKPWSSF